MNQSDCSISCREPPGLLQLNVTARAELSAVGLVRGAELTAAAQRSYFLEGGQTHVPSKRDLENAASLCFPRDAAGEVGRAVLQEASAVAGWSLGRCIKLKHPLSLLFFSTTHSFQLRCHSEPSVRFWADTEAKWGGAVEEQSHSLILPAGGIGRKRSPGEEGWY